MRVCDYCGRVFDELPQSKEDGVYYCPVCGSETDVGDFCEVCHEIALDDCMVNGVCQDCIDDESKRFATQFAYGEDRTSMVEINGLLGYVFTTSEINGILKNELLKKLRFYSSDREKIKFEKACKDFCMDDTYDFAKWLIDNN